MLIRKNTKLFKTIQQLITDCQNRADRDQLIRLYITKAGETVQNRIGIEGIQGDAALFYEMTYQTVLSNMKSANHQLHASEEIPGIYFFHSSTNKVWDETPFEFDEAIKRVFGALPELPALRKKETTAKFVLPSSRSKHAAPVSKEKATDARALKPRKGPRQPDFQIRHEIHFTNVEKLVFRQAGVTRQDLFTYYERISEYLLSYLKDRPLSVRLQSDNSGRSVILTAQALFKDNAELIPSWVKTAIVSKDKEGERLVLCNDKEHLLLCVEMGCLEFIPGHSRMKQIDSPDYMVIGIDSSESQLGKAIDVALTANEILKGLKLPSFVKTDGASGLQIYVPLDAEDDFQTSRDAAAYICKLIGLKVSGLVTLKESGYVRGKVSLDYTLNGRGKGVIAPYSFVAGQSPVLAVPLLWEEVKEGLRVEDFSHETILSRLKEIGDPFHPLLRKKANAGALLKRLEENYSFLF